MFICCNIWCLGKFYKTFLLRILQPFWILLFFIGRSWWPWNTSEVPTSRSPCHYRGDEVHHGFEPRILQERCPTTVDSRKLPNSCKGRFRCFKIAWVHSILLLAPGGHPFDLSPGWDRGSGRSRRTLRKPTNSKLTRLFQFFYCYTGAVSFFAYIVQKNLSLLCCSVSKNLTFESMMFWCISNMFFCLACSGIHTKHQWFPKKIIKIFQKTKSVSQKNYKIYKNQKKL